MGRAVSEGITYLIHQLEKLIHSEWIPRVQGTHRVHVFLHPVLPLLWCVMKYSYPACFELCSRWKSTAVKGWDGFFCQGWQKEFVSWIFWVSYVFISNIVWISFTLAICWLIFSHNNLVLHVCVLRMSQSNDETSHWVILAFFFMLQWMGDRMLILVSFLFSLLMKWWLLFWQSSLRSDGENCN